MNRTVLGKILAAGGLFLLMYAMFFMDVSVDGRVVNLELLNRRQNLVILGGLKILVGVLLWLLPGDRDGALKAEGAYTPQRTLPKLSSNQWRSLLGHAAFLLGLFFVAKYLYMPIAETTRAYLIAALILFAGSLVCCGTIVFLWISGAGLTLLLYHVFTDDWRSTTVLAISFLLMVLPPVFLRKRIFLLRKDFADWRGKW